MRRLLLAIAITAAAPAAAREAANVIMPLDPLALAQQQQYGYAQAVIVGDTVYLSGVVAAPAPGDVGLEPGYERAFAYIAGVLKRAGVGWDDVVDITTFHTDLESQISAIAAVKNRYVRAPFPAWTAIGNARLFEPTGITEIKVVAHRRKR